MASASNRVLVLSDDERVALVVEMAAKPVLETVTRLTDELEMRGAPLPEDSCNYALIILALSAYQSEPVVVLARASMAAQIGRVPLLIISDRVFPSDEPTRITHMDFPFTVGQLTTQIQAILGTTRAEIDLR